MLLSVVSMLSALVPAQVSSPSAPGAPVAKDDAAFVELANRWLTRRALTEGEVRSGSWTHLVEHGFGHLDLGSFKLHVPLAELREGDGVARVAESVQALFEVQQGWVRWAGGPATTAPPADVLAWLRSWSPGTFAHVPEDGDLAQLAGARTRAALASWSTAMGSGAWLGLTELGAAELFVFPRRAEFVEFVALVGWLDKFQRASAWNSTLGTWLEYVARDWQLVTLEYGGVGKSEAVEKRNPKALRELVAQVASRALLARLSHSELDPGLAGALANAMVIDLYDELDTRIDGDVRGRSSQGRSEFVPGGNPNGGILPATSAENRWRSSKGKDHFLVALGVALKQGAHGGASKLERQGSFELVSDDGDKSARVSAPFLGPGGKAPEAALLPDYLELLRCYGVGFLHWLRTRESGNEVASAKRFADFLQLLARDTKAAELPKLFQQAYGEPLSATKGAELFESPTLEGRFLSWLAKH
ncbi:MAG: hypothetical protein EXS08_14805 [Planctomycetes bacterium]|nr:hypothetical protein [Planctomycetota bacterium]